MNDIARLTFDDFLAFRESDDPRSLEHCSASPLRLSLRFFEEGRITLGCDMLNDAFHHMGAYLDIWPSWQPANADELALLVAGLREALVALEHGDGAECSRLLRQAVAVHSSMVVVER